MPHPASEVKRISAQVFVALEVAQNGYNTDSSISENLRRGDKNDGR
jgi:hypothetical protein